jgi:hypothetical protein
MDIFIPVASRHKQSSMQSQLSELIQFLQNDARIELKSVALSHILGKIKLKASSCVA